MQKYYNKKTNTYYFYDDVTFNCNIDVSSNIEARNVNGGYIKAEHISAWDIKAVGINVRKIYSWNLKAFEIEAVNIDAHDISVCNIKAINIYAWDIKAKNINAFDISFNAICCAYETFVCNSIEGRRENSKYFCLDGEVVIKSKQ